MKIILALLLATILITSLVANAEALSKIEKKVNKFLRDNTAGGSKLSDLCTVTILTEDGKRNVTLTLKECGQVEPEPTPDPEPIPDNDTDPIPDPEPVPDNDTDPIPIPVPENETATVIMVGDVFGETGKKVAQSIKDKNPDLVVALGDLGYKDDDSYIKEVYAELGNSFACVIGNHDKGISELEDYCGNDYFLRIHDTLLIALNTEGDFTRQGNEAVNRLNDPEVMENITSVHIMTHFPWKAPPNSHHPEDEDTQAESASEMIQKVLDAIPSGIEKFSDNGHNHGLAEGKVGDVVVTQSGGGGRERYDCDTNTQFPYCDNVYGFLEYQIEPDGDTTWTFYNENGGKIR